MDQVAEKSIAELQAAMQAREITARALVAAYLVRIEALDKNGPKLNSVLEINPDALAIAEASCAGRKYQVLLIDCG